MNGGDSESARVVDISCQDAASAKLPDALLDAVFTDPPHELAQIVENDLSHLRAGNVKPTRGDIRCVTYGHLIRLAIWSLRLDWNKNEPTTSRITKVADWLQSFGGWAAVEKCIEHVKRETSKDIPLFSAHESDAKYGEEYAEIPF